MSHFYLTLPSNSSATYYDDNTLTRFTTKLLSSISLSGDWEVGLTEMIFPRTWMTLNKKEATFALTTGAPQISDRISFSSALLTTTEVRVPYGYYESVNDLVFEISKSLSKLLPTPVVSYVGGVGGGVVRESIPSPKIKYNEVSRRIQFDMHRNQSLSFHPTLASILGVSSDQNPSKAANEETYNWTGDDITDITRGIKYLMVYCDLLEHVPVGDTKAPLLRIVDATGTNGESIHRMYESPRYIPVQKKNYDSIEIVIRDDIGNPIAFETGKLVVTLHFRQAKSPYFL